MHQIDYELGFASEEEEEWDAFLWTPSTNDNVHEARAKRVLKSCVYTCTRKNFCCGKKVRRRRQACKDVCYSTYKVTIAKTPRTYFGIPITTWKNPCAAVRCGAGSKPKVVGGKCKCVPTPTTTTAPPTPTPTPTPTSPTWTPPITTWTQDLPSTPMPIGRLDAQADLPTSNGEEKKSGLGGGAMIGIAVLALAAIGYVMFRK